MLGHRGPFDKVRGLPAPGVASAEFVPIRLRHPDGSPRRDRHLHGPTRQGRTWGTERAPRAMLAPSLLEARFRGFPFCPLRGPALEFPRAISILAPAPPPRARPAAAGLDVQPTRCVRKVPSPEVGARSAGRRPQGVTWSSRLGRCCGQGRKSGLADPVPVGRGRPLLRLPGKVDAQGAWQPRFLPGGSKVRPQRSGGGTRGQGSPSETGAGRWPTGKRALGR
jgi:hypothetical protein